MATIDLAFEVFGESSDPALIILHGFFASSRNWRQIAEKLADKRRTFVLDLRNHGESAHHPIMDYPAMAADLLAFMDNQGLQTASLLGHSMGGKVAMWFALNQPERIGKLIVADIAPVSYQHCFNNLIVALKLLPLSDLTNRKQAEVFLAEAIPDLSFRQFLLQNLVLQDGEYRWRINLDYFQQAAAGIVAFPDTANLAPFLGKSLFLAGADSDFVKPEQLCELFPNAQLQYIADAAHWLHVQQPKIFLEKLKPFLDAN